jgi:hypothetical protein
MVIRVTYVDNLIRKGCHVEFLDRTNRKFNEKNKLLLTLIT